MKYGTFRLLNYTEWCRNTENFLGSQRGNLSVIIVAYVVTINKALSPKAWFKLSSESSGVQEKAKQKKIFWTKKLVEENKEEDKTAIWLKIYSNNPLKILNF